MKIMIGFALTPDRRDELAALLGDEARFTADYPKVADYLATAPGLPGTGDAEVDNAFDLRLLHYMTGDHSDNPYWDIVAPLVNSGPRERDGRRKVNGGRSDGSGRLAYAQLMLQATYAYAIPAPETLEWVATNCQDGGLLEVGAGRGYWANLLSRRGVDVLAYDSEPPDRASNVSFPAAPGQRTVWFPVGDLDDMARLEASSGFSDRTLFLCWPPGWGDGMALDVLNRFVAAGGDRLIFIGELRGGMTGTDEFFDLLSDDWSLTSADPSFVSWWNLSDVAQRWDRRR